MAPSPKQPNKHSKAAKSHCQAVGNSTASLQLNASDDAKPALDLAGPAIRDGDQTSKARDEELACAELNESADARCIGMNAVSAADQSPLPLDNLSWAALTHPYVGPLLTAAQAVLEMFDGHIGLRDEDYLPVIEARRIRFGLTDGFVAAHVAVDAARLGSLGQVAPNNRSEDWQSPNNTVPLSRIDTELGAGLRLLGRLALNGQAPPIGGQAVEVSGSTVPSSSDETSAASKVISQSMPVPLETSPEVIALTVAKFAKRWGYSKRYIETCLRQGLPKCGEGRGRRIPIAEGDAWMWLHRDPLARRASEAAKRHSMPNKPGSKSSKEGPENAGS